MTDAKASELLAEWAREGLIPPQPIDTSEEPDVCVIPPGMSEEASDDCTRHDYERRKSPPFVLHDFERNALLFVAARLKERGL